MDKKSKKYKTKLKSKFIIIHFGEIWLKGRNRSTFIKKLYNNIIVALRDEKFDKLYDKRDKFLLALNNKSNINSILNKLKYVFGISWFAPVFITKNDIKDIIKTANNILDDSKDVKIIANRSFKKFKLTSYEIVSEFIKEKNKLNFNIDKNGKAFLYINITNTGAFLYTEKINGANGLPVGSSGKAVILLSGGIDSPIAAFYAMKRGLAPIYLHLHAFSNNNNVLNSKILEILKLLSRYEPLAKCYIVPSHYYQTSILGLNSRNELVLFKHFLYKIAHKIALKEGANSIVTGESIGQVASQTVKNLISTEYDIEEFIMRPLIGFDKQEIIDIARKLGTYETSIKFYPDVCSMKAKNQSTLSNPKIIETIYKKYNLPEIEDKSLDSSLIIKISDI
ncbi:MAG: tRNA uracil 4-sulfurtransferase ThiI [Candidatus Micrarchaeia archaeon]